MHTTRLNIVVMGLFVALGIVMSLQPTCAEEPNNGDLVRFLPNHGNSVYQVSGLLRKWPTEGPKELWRTEIGWGKSLFIMEGPRAYFSSAPSSKPSSRMISSRGKFAAILLPCCYDTTTFLLHTVSTKVY